MSKVADSKLLGEFQLIQRVQTRQSSVADDRVIVGIGDDCAVLAQGSREKYLMVTTDMLVDGVHFTSLYSSFRQIGQKAMLVNISDIAAMGGSPTFAFLSLALPASLGMEQFDALTEGIIKTAKEYSISILGGDTNAASPCPCFFADSLADFSAKQAQVKAHGLVINITLLGEVAVSELITRKGAKPDDLILVTGQLGDSAAGLDLLRTLNGVTADKISLDHHFDYHQDTYQQVILRHQVPVVRLAEARLISQHHLATAMIDLSDGLAGDIRHICQQGGVGAMLWPDKIPVSETVKEIAGAMEKPSLSYALSGGEDYELLFTVSPEKAGQVRELVEQTGTRVSIIGRIAEKKKGICLVDADGQTIPLFEYGFNHFIPCNS